MKTFSKSARYKINIQKLIKSTKQKNMIYNGNYKVPKANTNKRAFWKNI